MSAWIGESLAELGIEPTGPIEHVRQRPWAAIALVPTAEGPLHFKADAPSESYEPALTQWLSQRRPDVIAGVARIDVEQGWLLTRDAGTQLRERLSDPPEPAIWEAILPLYAELQIELSHSVEDLLALGVPDKRADRIVTEYDELVARVPDAARVPSREQIKALVDAAGDTIPASLAHEEVQDHNILFQEDDPVFIDWAEAAIGHPFCGSVNTFRGLVDRWGFEPGSEGLFRLRDTYLEPWATFAPLPRLIDVFEAAYPLGMVCRALSWDRLVTTNAASDLTEYERFVPVWLEMAAETIGGKARLGW